MLLWKSAWVLPGMVEPVDAVLGFMSLHQGYRLSPLLFSLFITKGEASLFNRPAPLSKLRHSGNQPRFFRNGQFVYISTDLFPRDFYNLRLFLIFSLPTRGSEFRIRLLTWSGIVHHDEAERRTMADQGKACLCRSPLQTSTPPFSHGSSKAALPPSLRTREASACLSFDGNTGSSMIGLGSGAHRNFRA